MIRPSIQKSFDRIAPDEQAKARMLEKILSDASKIPPAGKDATMKKRKMMPVLIAAVIALSILMMGSAIVVHVTIASREEHPLIDPAQVDPAQIQLSVSDVSSTSMHVFCVIDGVQPGVNDIFILENGPFTIEEKTEQGWQTLPAKLDDPKWSADRRRTDGSTDYYVDWSAVYGILENGTYRYTTTVLEGNVATSVEFTVVSEQRLPVAAQLKQILDGSYYIRYDISHDFAPAEMLSEEQQQLEDSMKTHYVYEYWKSDADLMQLIYADGQLSIGMLYQNGEKYSLQHEGDDRTNPIIGWMQWPALDVNRLTEWISHMPDYDQLQAAYDTDGTLKSLTYVETTMYEGAELEVTTTEKWEIVSTEPALIKAKFLEQNVDSYLEFSWAEDQVRMNAQNVSFVNQDFCPIANASEAIERAMAECTVEHNRILVYRDESAGMWKVEFQINYGYIGYQYVYLNDAGVTQMISEADSKVEEWRENT